MLCFIEIIFNLSVEAYEYSDFVSADGESIEFDSYMVPESDLELGQLRLLDVDNRVVVPVDTHIRFIVTGQDVIHDFAVPSLGVKIDAIPGYNNLLTNYHEGILGQDYQLLFSDLDNVNNKHLITEGLSEIPLMNGNIP
jgi:hypothetical protein